MALHAKAVLGILADNLKKRGSVLPLSKKKSNGWARGLDIPAGGETILYTGHMYQLIPTISAMAVMMARLEDSWITRFMDLGRIANKFFNVSVFMSRADKSMQEEFDGTLRRIAILLREAGVEFGYLYEKEMYSGALIHDQGVDESFIAHARKVQELLAKNGVKRVITVDPHTTNMLKSVYPEMLGDFDIEVKSYFELLDELEIEPVRKIEGDVTIHESCIYARYEDIIDQPRRLLGRTGVDMHMPELSGLNTHCCGGPIESLFPSKAHMVAQARIEQLLETGSEVAAMCPICMVNLRGAASGKGVNIKDISEYLAKSYCKNGGSSDG